MGKSTSAKIQLKAALPKIIQVNKPVVVVLFAVLSFIVIFAVVSAFNISHARRDTQSQYSGLLRASDVNEKNGEFSSALKNLPQGYQDTVTIKKLTGGNDNNKSVNELQKDIESLQQQDNKLRQEVTQLTESSVAKSSQVSEQQIQQAKSSAIFFNGITPSSSNTDRVFKSIANSSSNDANANRSKTNYFEENVVPTATTTDSRVQKISAATQNFYSKENAVQQKMAVLKATDNVEDIYDLHNLTQPVSPYEIQAGGIIQAVLITGVNTALAGTVVAQSRFNVYDTVTGKYLLIPRGSRIVGEYDARVSYGQRRVLLTFNRIIRPDGSSILIGKPTAADIQGEAGVDGKVDNHWGRILAAATLSTILSVGAGVAADNSGSDNTYYRNSGQGAILGGANNISQIGTNMTNRAFDMQPTITLNPGYQFNIIVRRDMVLSPYPSPS